MELCHFVQMHHTINTVSESKIKSIVSSLDAQCIKQLLSIYCQFMFNLNNRNKYINNNNNHPSNDFHLKIIHQIRKQRAINRNSNKFNPFNILPQLLTSYIISFLDNKTRLRISLTNISLFKASNETISKYDLKINRSFIETKLCKKENIFNTNKFKNISSFSIHSMECIKRGGKKK
eukprot:44984_1